VLHQDLIHSSQTLDLSRAQGVYWLTSATAFAISMCLTPGPNNAMVTASGATFGFARTAPHILGIVVGVPAMMIVIALGAGGFLQSHVSIRVVMKWVSAAYLLWLAWRISTARPPSADTTRRSGSPLPSRPARPLTFVQAALFQWINPKAWAAAISAIGAYTSATGAIFAVVCLPAVALWTGVGVGAARLLRTERALHRFNLAMAALLVASLAPLMIER
jgi:threonine/homoserine/homoserine lactone efflux protein